MSKTWYGDLPKFYQRQIAAMGLDEAGMTRRRLMKSAAAAAGVATFVGAITRAHAATQMQYMCWEGYNDPRIIDPFNKANDTDIAFDLIVDSPGGFATLQAGASREVDLVSTDMPWVTRMGPAGLALELNPDDYADVYATFYDQFKPPFEPLLNEGKTIGVATRWGWVGGCINTDITSPDAWRTYDPVFDAKNKDKICVMDWGDWPILPMALHAGINPYEELDDATEDYAAVKDLYSRGVIDTYDAAVVNRDFDGTVHVSKREKPTEKAAWTGAIVGAVVGVLFPPAIVPMAAAGGIAGGLLGHIMAGMSRGDLKDLGETLDIGTAALIVIGKTSLSEKLAKAVTRAQKRIEKRLKIDAKDFDKELADAAKSMA